MRGGIAGETHRNDSRGNIPYPTLRVGVVDGIHHDPVYAQSAHLAGILDAYSRQRRGVCIRLGVVFEEILEAKIIAHLCPRERSHGAGEYLFRTERHADVRSDALGGDEMSTHVDERRFARVAGGQCSGESQRDRGFVVNKDDVEARGFGLPPGDEPAVVLPEDGPAGRSSRRRRDGRGRDQ